MGNLTEFESGSAVGLAPFEKMGGILLDEIAEIPYGMLTEFESPVEFINLNEPRSETSAVEPNEDVDSDLDEPETVPSEPIEPAPDAEPHQKPVEEPEMEPDNVGVGEEDELIGDESEFIEPVDEIDYGAREKETGKIVGDELLDLPEREILREPEKPIIGFVCEHAINLSGIVNQEGWMRAHPMVRLIKVPCAGMVKMSWLEDAIGKGASGVVVISCSVENCYHRTGAKLTSERWTCKREPCIDGLSDNPRVKLLSNYRAARNEFLSDLDKFIASIGMLDSAEL